MNTSPTFRRNVALAAALVVVFCLGAISGSQSQSSLGLGLHERLQAHTPTYLHPYLTNNVDVNSTTTRLEPNISISISSSNPCPAQCPEDPYARAGMIIFPPFSDFAVDDGDREYDPAMTRWAPFPPLQREQEPKREQDGMTGIGRVKGMRTKAVDRVIDRARSRDEDGDRNRDPAGAGSRIGKKLTDSEKEEEESGAGAGGYGWGWGWGWDRVKGQDQGRRIDRREQRRDRSRSQPSRRQEGQSNLSPTSPYTVALSNKDEELIGFARGRVGLFVGSSHDRNNVVNFCKAIGGRTQTWGFHIGTICHLDWLDFKIVSWFLVGMVDDDSYDWFRGSEQRPVMFEHRIPEIMLPIMEEVGLKDVTPDLITIGSLFWDEAFLTSHRLIRGYGDKEGTYGFYPEELRWHRTRVAELIQFFRGMYGEEVPMMLRTRQHRGMDEHGGKLKIAQLDQSLRSIAKEMDVKLFTWGDKLEGWLKYEDHDQHFGFGPSTYLFGDMFMFYLRQATIPRCWVCRESPVA